MCGVCVCGVCVVCVCVYLCVRAWCVCMYVCVCVMCVLEFILTISNFLFFVKPWSGLICSYLEKNSFNQTASVSETLLSLSG